MYSKESLLYWKKVYLLLGQEFSHDDWSGESFEDDGYDPKIHGHPYDNLDKWVETSIDVNDGLNDWATYRFTDKFLEDISDDKI